MSSLCSEQKNYYWLSSYIYINIPNTETCKFSTFGLRNVNLFWFAWFKDFCSLQPD